MGRNTFLLAFITRYRAQKGPCQDSLELALPHAAYRVPWIRPRDGKLLREERVTHDGAKLRLTSPRCEEADVTICIRS